MQETGQNRFTLCFDGRCQSGFQEAEVRKGLARVFGVPLADTEGLFSGEAVFIKTDLNALSLKQYVTAMERIGAQCRYWKQAVELAPPAIAQAGAGSISCPKCGHLQESDVECAQCGIVFEKYRLVQEKTAAELVKPADAESEDTHFEDSDYDPDARRARTGIRLGSTLLVCVFLVDTIVQYRGIDIGYWPYSLSNLCFLYGGWYFAKRRGYGPVVRMLGGLNLLGLAILYLLQDRTSRARPEGSIFKSTAAAVLTIIVACYWGIQYYHGQSDLSAILSFTDTIHIRERLYPSEIMTDEADFERNRETMHRLVDIGFATLSENEFRPDDVRKVSRLMFSTLADYFIWLNYQQYLNAQAYEELPEYLTQKHVSELKIEFQNQILELAKGDAGLSTHPSFARVYYAWAMSCNQWDFTLGQCVDFGNRKNEQMDAYLWRLYEHFREQELIASTVPDRADAPNREPIPGYPKNIFASVEMIGDTIIDLRLQPNKLGEMSGKRLVLAFYKRPYRRFGKLNHYSAFACIGGDLPNKFLQSDLSVFHEWRMGP
jgi:hypothetical protein